MAGHPSPFNRQRHATKALDPNGQTPKFLYAMLKQLDLKNLDWNKVASNLDITNGHAARMRWSRFRAQIEGLDNSYSRRGKKKGPPSKKRKTNSDQIEDVSTLNQAEDDVIERWKIEYGADVKMGSTWGSFAPTNPINISAIKNEPTERTSVINGVTVHHPTVLKINGPQASTTPNANTANGYSGFYSHLPQTTNPTFATNIQRPRSLTSTQSTTPWLQQHANSYIPSPQAPGISAPMYFATPPAYNGQYQFPAIFPTQLRHYTYGPQSVQYQPQPLYAHASNNQDSFKTPGVPPSVVKSNKLNNQPPSNIQRPEQSLVSPSPSSANWSTPTNKIRQPILANSGPSIQAQAYELASQASYPWPPNEASVPAFMHQAETLLQTATNENVNSYELTEPEHPKNQPDIPEFPSRLGTFDQHGNTMHAEQEKFQDKGNAQQSTDAAGGSDQIPGRNVESEGRLLPTTLIEPGDFSIAVKIEDQDKTSHV